MMIGDILHEENCVNIASVYFYNMFRFAIFRDVNMIMKR